MWTGWRKQITNKGKTAKVKMTLWLRGWMVLGVWATNSCFCGVTQTPNNKSSLIQKGPK